MNKWTLASLKAKAEQIEFIDPSGNAYKELNSLLDGCSKEKLEELANAGIKWFSSMAKSRLAV